MVRKQSKLACAPCNLAHSFRRIATRMGWLWGSRCGVRCRRRCRARGEAKKRMARLLAHRHALGVDVQRRGDQEQVLERELPLAESGASNRWPSDAPAGGVRHVLVAPPETGATGRDPVPLLRHAQTCTSRSNIWQGPIVRPAKLNGRQRKPYSRRVSAGTLSDRFRAWLVAAWDADPRHSKRAVALRLGLPVPTVNRIIRGVRAGNVLLDTVGLIAQHTGFPPGFIVECIDKGQPLPAVSPVPSAHPPRRIRRRTPLIVPGGKT